VQGGLGLLANLVVGGSGRELHQVELVLGDIDDAQVGDDPLHHTFAGARLSLAASRCVPVRRTLDAWQ